MSRSAAPWEAAMRATNKAANGAGWNIRQLKHRAQVTQKLETGRKPSVLTEIPWQPDKATEILNAVQEIRAFVEKGNSIQEANELRLKALARPAARHRRSESSTGLPRPTTSWRAWIAAGVAPSTT